MKTVTFSRVTRCQVIVMTDRISCLSSTTRASKDVYRGGESVLKRVLGCRQGEMITTSHFHNHLIGIEPLAIGIAITRMHHQNLIYSLYRAINTRLALHLNPYQYRLLWIQSYLRESAGFFLHLRYFCKRIQRPNLLLIPGRAFTLSQIAL